MAVLFSSQDQKKINTMLMDFHTVRNSLASLRVNDSESADIKIQAVETLRSIGNQLTGLGLEFKREAGFEDG